MNVLIVVATEAEAKLASETYASQNILVTGVGGCNVVRALKDVAKNVPIINFGYAGSNRIPVGTKCRIGTCKLYHPSVEYDEPTYELSGNVACYTAGDFVQRTDIDTPCVFDMELAYILALGFTNVSAIKIVSDQLDYDEYDKIVKETWKCTKK